MPALSAQPQVFSDLLAPLVQLAKPLYFVPPTLSLFLSIRRISFQCVGQCLRSHDLAFCVWILKFPQITLHATCFCDLRLQGVSSKINEQWCEDTDVEDDLCRVARSRSS